MELSLHVYLYSQKWEMCRNQRNIPCQGGKVELNAYLSALDPSVLAVIPANAHSRDPPRGGALQRRVVPCPPSLNWWGEMLRRITIIHDSFLFLFTSQ